MIKYLKQLTNEDIKNLSHSTVVYGHFNTIHAGHIRYLNYAKEQGNHLVIALLGEPKEGSKSYQFSQEERADSLNCLNLAKTIICLKSNELSILIKILNPNKLILGREFEGSKDYQIRQSIKLQLAANKEVKFHAGEVHYATTDFLTKSGNELSQERKKQYIQACKRQNINKKDLIKYIDDWGKVNLIVLGDTIVDEYTACEAMGMSAEAPVIVVRELESKSYLGGASIVASHISSLGAKCALISVVGNDPTADLVRQDLKKRNITDGLVVDKLRPTTFKKRYVVENQKLFRVSRLEDSNIDKDIENKIIEKLEILAPESDGIILSDFVYGVITEKILETVYKLAKEFDLILCGDLQCSSQVGSILKYKNFSLLCPNEREARIALQEKNLGLESLSRKLIRVTNAENLIMKLSANGLIAYEKNNLGDWSSQAFPALSINALDVTGAGDSLLSIMSVGLASKHPFMATAAISSCMSALAVESMGNVPIGTKKLKIYLESIFN